MGAGHLSLVVPLVARGGFARSVDGAQGVDVVHSARASHAWRRHAQALERREEALLHEPESPLHLRGKAAEYAEESPELPRDSTGAAVSPTTALAASIGQRLPTPDRLHDRGSPREWAVLTGTLLICLLVDLLFAQRTAMSFRLAACLVCLWQLVALMFAAYIYAERGRSDAVVWCVGYYMEWLLSIDNLLVFGVIFSVYRTPESLIHRALFSGIAGAFLARLAMFFVLSKALAQGREWQAGFGVFLMFTGAQAVFDDGDAPSDKEVLNSPLGNLFKYFLGSRLYPSYTTRDSFGGGFVVVSGGKYRATMLVLVMASLEAFDAMLAVDSTAAKVAAIPDPFLACSSSVLAALGLRTMYYFLRRLSQTFGLLSYGIGVSITFIGAEQILARWFVVSETTVCACVVAVLLISMLASVVMNKVGTGAQTPHEAG